MLRKIKAAASDMVEHVVAHRELNDSLPPEDVLLWTCEVEAWERDPREQNPFEATVNSEPAQPCDILHS